MSHSTTAGATARQRPTAALLRRIAPALGVFLMAPLTAEYLTGYDSSTGNLAALLYGLLFLAPLYGAPALIIRETARRSGRGWPTMVLWGLALGVVQAGLIDHSLFNTSYRDIDYWQSLIEPTFIRALGISASSALHFVVGHAVWSFSVPIAVFEALVPRRATTPWLGTFGLATVIVLYAGVAALIFGDHVEQEQFLPSPAQLIGTAIVVVGLIGAGLLAGRRQRPRIDRAAPSPAAVGVLTFVALSLQTLIELVLGLLGHEALLSSASWPGTVLYALQAAVLAAAVWYWSRSARWSGTHRLAVAAAALLTNAVVGFFVVPLGDVPLAAKLLHNVAFAAAAIGVVAIAARRQTETMNDER